MPNIFVPLECIGVLAYRFKSKTTDPGKYKLTIQLLSLAGPLNVDKALLVQDSGFSCTVARSVERSRLLWRPATQVRRNL